MLVTELGMVTEVSWLLEKAALPMLVTESGMVTAVIDLPWNAPVQSFGPVIAFTSTPPIVLGMSTARGQAGLAGLLAWLS